MHLEDWFFSMKKKIKMMKKSYMTISCNYVSLRLFLFLLLVINHHLQNMKLSQKGKHLLHWEERCMIMNKNKNLFCIMKRDTQRSTNCSVENSIHSTYLTVFLPRCWSNNVLAMVHYTPHATPIFITGLLLLQSMSKHAFQSYHWLSYSFS